MLLYKKIPNGVAVLLSSNYLNRCSEESKIPSDSSKSMLIYQIYLKDPKNNDVKILDISDKKIDIATINYNPFERLLFHKNLKYYCVPYGIENQLYPSVDNIENNQKSLLVLI